MIFFYVSHASQYVKIYWLSLNLVASVGSPGVNNKNNFDNVCFNNDYKLYEYRFYLENNISVIKVIDLNYPTYQDNEYSYISVV